MTDLTAARALAREAKERAERATLPAWEAYGLLVRARGKGLICHCFTPQNGGTFACMENAAFIVHARNNYERMALMLLELAEEVEWEIEGRDGKYEKKSGA